MWFLPEVAAHAGLNQTKYHYFLNLWKKKVKNKIPLFPKPVNFPSRNPREWMDPQIHLRVARWLVEIWRPVKQRSVRSHGRVPKFVTSFWVPLQFSQMCSAMFSTLIEFHPWQLRGRVKWKGKKYSKVLISREWIFRWLQPSPVKPKPFTVITPNNEDPLFQNEILLRSVEKCYKNLALRRARCPSFRYFVHCRRSPLSYCRLRWYCSSLVQTLIMMMSLKTLCSLLRQITFF